MEKSAEGLVMRVFLKALDLVGGLQEIVEQKGANWLPSLLLACYSVVLREEHLKTEQEIAQHLGITLQTVKNILRAEPSKASQEKELNIHSAGSLAKLAYRLVKDGVDDIRLSLEFFKSFAETMDITWAHMILRKLKWDDFPIGSPQDLKERLKKVYIRGRSAKEVLEELEYPIRTPAELLKNIKENLRMYGLE